MTSTIKVLAISDVHGYLRELTGLLKRIVPTKSPSRLSRGQRRPYVDPITGVSLDGTPPDLMVFVGDMVHQASQIDRLWQVIPDIKRIFDGPILMVRGNHEKRGIQLDDELFIDSFRRAVPQIMLLVDEVVDIYIPRVNRSITVGGIDYRKVKSTEVDRWLEGNPLIEALTPANEKQLDILLHHLPARNVLDLTGPGELSGGLSSNRGNKGRVTRHIGDPVVAKVVDTLRPRLSICGHCHESRGVLIGDPTTYVNASAFRQKKGYKGVPMEPRLLELRI